MKGFIIYEDYRGKKVVEAVKLGAVNYVTSSSDGDWVSELSGIRKSSTQAYCNEEDTYDFETGALIALMKMCGFDKSYKAIEEAFKYNSYDAKKSKELEEENRELKKRINDLENYNNQLEERVAAEQRGGYKLLKDMEKLQHDYDLCKNSENALKCSVDYLNKTIAKLNTAIYAYKEDLNKVTKRCEELEIKESMLNKQEEAIKKREEKLFVYFGGRQNGKQYTLLVELFKNIDQKKVDAAYKEAYNTTLPVWQKEVLKQMYDIHKESKEKIELQGFHIEAKPSTKREQMWNDILACGDCEHSKYVEVKKEDLEAFAKECNEKKIFSISGYEFHLQEFWFADDRCIFQIFRKPAGFICAKSVGFAYEDSIVDYLTPMRWDLFEKGRKIVRVTPENIDDFILKCTNKFGSIMKPVLKRYKDFTHAFIMISDYHYDNKPTIHIMTPEDLVRNQHENPKKYSDKKIVNWEDVR